jgi:DnaJ like chaperone protein
MSIWGKLAGAATGLAVGGPIGALLGGVAGHYAIDRDQEQDGPAGNQIAFTVGVIALGAKMAKADGLVTEDDVNAFKEAFKVPEGEMQNVARIFNLAKQDVSGYEAYADQLATMFKGNRKLLEDVLDGLFHIAWADNNLHPSEVVFLADVAKRFSFTEKEFAAISARQALTEKRNPYHALGVSADISNEALTSHYRKLVMENHPGNLVARGVPKEFVTIASKRMSAINQAYAAIAKQRRRPPQAFKAGEAIFREGEKADTMYVIRSGEVVIERAGKVVATLPKGSMFGEMALIDGSPRSATARAKTDCEVTVIGQETFLYMIHETPFFATAVMRTLVDRLRQSTVTH